MDARPTAAAGGGSPAGAGRVALTSAERYVMSGGRHAHLAIKEGERFLYTSDVGRIPGGENSEFGLYYRDTRFLSRFELVVAGRYPVLLSSTAESGYAATIELTNLESRTADGRPLPQATIHIRCTRFLDDRLRERVDVHNYHNAAVELSVDVHVDADFADIFDVRGFRRRRHGTRLPARVDRSCVTYAAIGLDGVTRETAVRFLDAPESLQEGRARYRLRLAPGENVSLTLEVETHVNAPAATSGDGFDEGLTRVGAVRRLWDSEATHIGTDNELLNNALRRGREDLRTLSAEIEGQRVVLSGVPWFVAPFGREMCFGGLMAPLLDLRWARAAVDFLGAHLGRCDSAFREEQPGKVMHELRRGELAGAGLITQTPYYGAIDTTPLWLLLVSELTLWSGDLDGFVARQEEVAAALDWIDRDGDFDGDGFVEYERRSRAGLTHQGWRDRGDAILHKDGTPAEGPIALAETQGYVYYAKRRLAGIYGQLGDVHQAERLAKEAAQLRQRFNEAFWMPEEGYYAMALDGDKRQVRTVCSTIGHALWSRIISDEHVPAVVARLMEPDMHSGWGLRTLSSSAHGYNPVSFYNGSVWPFDTAIAAFGMKKHGFAAEANTLAWELVQAAVAHEYARLPELYCGFARQSSGGPVTFPMACAPDAASSGALFLLLQSMLGIYAQAEANIVYVHNPELPPWLGEVTLRDLRVGHTTMHLRFRREGRQTTLAVLDKHGPGRIIIVD